MNPDESRDSFVSHLEQNFHLNTSESNAIFDDITLFLNESTHVESKNSLLKEISVPTEGYIEQSYKFSDNIVTIRYESAIVQTLVHPQITHHCIDNTSNYDVLFDIFKTDDDLHLFKDGIHIGSYKTHSFHFLQGKFALELTNTIHNTNINNWVATFHASTISNGKESVMLIGDSGNGKSTLSVLLMAHGFDILCDDFTPLYEDDLQLYRYPAATSIKTGAFEALKPYIENLDLLPTHTNIAKRVDIKYIPPILSYDSQVPSLPCNKIVYVKYDATKHDSLNQVSAEKILETLIPDSWISPIESHALKFIDWFKNIECYQLNYSDNNFAISKFKDLFEE